MGKVILCVNVDHIATVRQARGGAEPDPIEGAIICESSGASGITVHLREDRRHIQDDDVFRLKKVVKGKYNLEMALSDDIIAVATRLIPTQITLVPEKRQEITTEGGLDVKRHFNRIAEVVKHFHSLGVVVSLFIEPVRETVELSAKSGADYIEFHTGTYCEQKNQAGAEKEVRRIYESASLALEAGIRVNAGHGLNCSNVIPVLATPGLEELNIGHSIIARSIMTGIGKAVEEMVDIIGRHTNA
jgi:pyridoxine 5-phosphate synthase